MVRIILSGCNGKMGRFVTSCVDLREDCEIVAGVDMKAEMAGHYPVFTDFEDVKYEADVIIDFSSPALLPSLLRFAVSNQMPAVISTTGLSDNDVKMINEASRHIPIFSSFNMSLGINLLIHFAKKAAAALQGFDIEILEKHHNQKVDAPSGTALMIADGINKTLGDKMNYEYDRHSRREKRPKNEIGIHSIRGGTIIGEHEVIFAGHDEVITISHSAASREVFAVGAVNAAIFLSSQAPGLYDMEDLVNSK